MKKEAVYKREKMIDRKIERERERKRVWAYVLEIRKK